MNLSIKEIKSDEGCKAPGISKKTMLVAVVVAVAVVAVFVMMLNLSSETEKQAVSDARTMQGMMKNPDSLVIYGDIVVLSHAYEDGSKSVITAIDHSGENSFGGTVRKTALFANGEYVGNYEDKVDVDKYSSKDEIEDAISLASTKLLLASSDSDERTTVDGRRVASKIGAQHKG